MLTDVAQTPSHFLGIDFDTVTYQAVGEELNRLSQLPTFSMYADVIQALTDD